MKFDKPSIGTLNTADDVVLANRFAERRSRLEAERLRPANREMCGRVNALFAQLIGELNARPKRASRWRGQDESAVPLTIEQMAELWRKNPVKLSAPALARPQMESGE